MIDFATHPDRYRHWRLDVDGAVATLTMSVAEDGGLKPGYQLKLDSYDLGVDIELYDAVQRLRFEHPEVGAVIVTSSMERVFCSGANIPMLSRSSHAEKVNFCKFTNETRNGIEDASENSHQRYICAINGTAAGGGYELALATDHIILADDGSSAVSLPEVPLLAVLPGTGGLTRVVDKRRVRRDHADFFCTVTEGVRGKRALNWRLVDELVPRSRLAEGAHERAEEFAAASDRPKDAKGIELVPLNRTFGDDEISYDRISVSFDRDLGLANITVRGPAAPPPADIAAIHAQGAAFWPLALARELDDLILHLRSNEPEIGTWVLKTHGDTAAVEAADKALADNADDLAGPRDHPLSEAGVQADRHDVAQPDRADRTGKLFHRHASGTRLGRGPQLHAGRHLRGVQPAGSDTAPDGDEFRVTAHVQWAHTSRNEVP